MNNVSKLESIKKWLGSGSINLFGKPFAGKDSQGKILSDILGSQLIGGGDILRSVDISEESRQIMSTGKLIPSLEYVKIVLPFLSQTSLHNKPLVLSSVGRWDGEQVGVINALNKSNHTLKSVIYIDIPDQVAYDRWLVRDEVKDRLNRRDDAKETLDIRIKEFNSKTLPVLNYYKNLGLLITINGVGSKEQVNKNIIDLLFHYLSQQNIK